MSWAGGTFTRVRNWAQDKLNGINPQAALFDQEDDNFATGINQCLNKDGSNNATGNLNLNNNRIVNLGNAFAGSDALNQNSADARYLIASQNLRAVKTATTSRTTTDVPADDPHLVLALPPGTFAVECWVPVWGTGGGGAQGIRPMFAFSGTSTGAIWAFQAFTGTPANDSGANLAFGTPQSLGTIFPAASIATSGWFRLVGTLTVTVAGNLSFRWSQNTSSANATNVGIGGWLMINKLA